MIERKHWPVVIVGAGPTGLTAACLLAKAGIDVLVVERNPSTVQEPRAVSIDDESLRTMQAVGVVGALIPNLVIGYGSDYFSPRGRRFLSVKPRTLEYGYLRRNAFRQPVLEGLLRERLLSLDRARIAFNTELVDFSQTPDAVSLRLRGAEGDQDIACDYLLGCDGGRSAVREAIGAVLKGSTFRERWLIIDLRATTDPTRDTKVYCDPERPCLSLPGPNGSRRFEFMLHDGETDAFALDDGVIEAMLHRHGTDDVGAIERKVVYTFHARLADRWRVGRVFLAGDAAHLMPPFAGQGMNSGVRDAHNIAWKLAAVIEGAVGPKLLETYETERRSHAGQMVDLAVRMGHVMMPRTPLRALALQSFFRALSLYPAARNYFAEMRYKPKPRFTEGFQLRDETGRRTSPLVGRLFPQAIVADPSGYRLLDDFLGDGFVLLASPGTSVAAMNQAFATRPKDLPILFVAVMDKEDAGKADAGVVQARDLRGELAALLGDHPPGLFLLRPDHYVAAFFDPAAGPPPWPRVEALFEATRRPLAD